MPADPVTEKHGRQSLPNLIERYIPRDWVFPIVLAVFVGVVVWFSHAIVSFVMPTGTLVRLPSFVGQTLPDAEAELARLGLKSAVTATSASKHYPKGAVVDQQPDAGVEVRTGREITLVISTGMQAELMPDLRFQGLREARLDISDAHLQLARTTFAKSDDVPANHVIAQHPLPLSRVAGGAPVTLTVSSGGAAQLRVPAFVGLNV
ncbi:MAG: PASTA domain-containing protein, partial [Firmicutes bacterium]|nr:PASTA domain-containing protein [Bacillota bacterium]